MMCQSTLLGPVLRTGRVAGHGHASGRGVGCAVACAGGRAVGPAHGPALGMVDWITWQAISANQVTVQ